MKLIIIVTGLAMALSAIASDIGLAEPVLMLNEPSDVSMAQYSCQSAADEIKSDQYLIKAFRCGEVELCQRAIDINAACKVSGPAAVVQEFYISFWPSSLPMLNAQSRSCVLTEGKSDAEVKNDWRRSNKQTGS